MANYDNEKSYVIHQLKVFFESHGWDVYPEKHPDHEKYKKWRVDMIIYHEKIGTYIGIEAKAFGMRNGGLVGKAIKQIYRYKDLTYLGGKKIDLWCFAGLDFTHFENEQYNILVRTILNEIGIGILDTRQYSNYSNPRYKELSYLIRFTDSAHWGRIFINDFEDDEMDIERIQNHVKNKLELKYFY